MGKRRTLVVAAAVAVLAAAAPPALAQSAPSNWPSRPIRFVVPYGPGSSPDVLVRLFSDKLAKALGQPVVVENRAGAGGNTGTDHVAKAAPDGYTFLVSTNGPLVYSTVFNPKLPYDPFKDLAPVTLAGVQPNVCAVSNELHVDDVKGWVAAMKKDPGKYNYASTGVGSMSHLSVEIVKLRSDSYAVHLPYASSPLAVMAVLQGEVQFACVPPVAVMPQAKAGKLKAVAVTSARRSKLAPELPTLAESGFPDIQALAWMAIMAPARTPSEIIERMNQEIVAILNEPDTQHKLALAYMESVGSTPQELGQWMVEERERWAPVIKRVGLSAN